MLKIAAPLVIVWSIVGCDGGGKAGGKDASIDGATVDASIDASSDAAIDAPMIDAPPGTFALTVKNYLNWCSVSVNGGAASTAATQTVNVMPGTIPLTATAASAAFIIAPNMWHHTTGDTGAGETGTVTGSGTTAQSAVTATVGGAPKCVWICCPFTNGTGCNVAEQCP